MTGERWQTALNAPEIQIAIFALLLNLPWEFWQSPFFAGLAHAQHWEAVVMCTRAAFGDVVIALFAFWSVCAIAGTREWRYLSHALAENRIYGSGAAGDRGARVAGNTRF